MYTIMAQSIQTKIGVVVFIIIIWHDGKRVKGYTGLMSPKNDAPRQPDMESGTKPNDAGDGEAHVGYVLGRNAPPNEIKEVINAFINLLAVTCEQEVINSQSIYIRRGTRTDSTATSGERWVGIEDLWTDNCSVRDKP